VPRCRGPRRRRAPAPPVACRTARSAHRRCPAGSRRGRRWWSGPPDGRSGRCLLSGSAPSAPSRTAACSRPIL